MSQKTKSIARPNLDKNKPHPISQTELRALCKQVGYGMGGGVYEQLVHHIEEHYPHFDPTRNVQWDQVNLKLNGDWFEQAVANENRRERFQFYVRDLIVSCVVHSGKIAGQCKRKTIQEADMHNTLDFLDDVY